MIKEIVEQDAIFDGEPDFLPLSAAISLMNHNSYGGTEGDLVWALSEGMEKPKRYKVRLILEVEEIPPTDSKGSDNE